MQKPKNAGGRPRTLPVSALGRKIEAAAKRRGMTRKAVAESAGLSSVTLHMICTGKIRDPKSSTLARIAAAVGVSVSRLLGSDFPSRSA